MGRYSHLVLTLVITLLLCAAPFGQGPIPLGDQLPLALVHSSFKPESPETVAQDKWAMRLAGTWTNTLATEGADYLIDGESGLFELDTRYGLSQDWEVGIGLELQARGGGILDHPIDQFHDAFSLPQGSRDDFPEDELVFAGANSDGTSFLIDDSGVELGDSTLRAKYKVFESQTAALSALLTLRIPTATHATFGQDSIDAQLGALGSYDLGGSWGYAGAAYTYFADTEMRGVHYVRHHGAAFVGWEYPLSDALAFLTAIKYESKLIEDLIQFPDLSVYWDFGLKYRVSGDNTLEFLLRENPSPGRGTADVSFLFGIGTTM